MSMLPLRMLPKHAKRACGLAPTKPRGHTEKNDGRRRNKALPKDAPSKGTFQRTARFTTRLGLLGILARRSRQQEENVGFVMKQKPLQQGGAPRIGTERTPQRPNWALFQGNFVILDYNDSRIQNTNETTNTFVFNSDFFSASDRRRSLPNHDLGPTVAAPKPPRKQGQNILSSCAKLELFSTALLLQEHFQLPRSAVVLHKLQLGRRPRWRQRRSAMRKPLLIDFSKGTDRWL